MWLTGRPVFAPVALVVMSLLGVALAVTTSASAGAQTMTDYKLSIIDAGPPVDDRTEILVTLDPGTSFISAIGAELSFDTARTSADSCVALVGLASCTIDADGLVSVAAIDVDGWGAPTDLFRVTFVSDDPMNPDDLSLVVTEAFNGDGQLISGTSEALLPFAGDVSCSRSLTIIDAVMIAQYLVGNRDGGETCPLGDDASELNLTVADVNASGTVTIADAVLIAQCVAGRANEFCPE